MPRKLTQKEVLERFKRVHGDKYDYSLVEYKEKDKKVIIVCPIHGDFQQTPHNHYKYGCRFCGKLISSKARRLTSEKFVEKAKLSHGDVYDYSLVEYVNAVTKVKIRCKKDGHGIFPQTPSDHFNGCGCPICGRLNQTNSRRKTKEKFVEEAKFVHGDVYDYSLVEYVNGITKVKIRCKKDGHGIFPKTPGNHLEGQGCPICGQIRGTKIITKSTEDFIEQAKEIHPDKNYDYEKVEYVNTYSKVIIVCPIHGDFQQTPKEHLHGSGCNDCGNIQIGENKTKSLEQFVEEANIIHGGLYMYDNVDYIKGDTNVSITCNIHGDFQQSPAAHIHQGQGCPRCFNKSEGRLAIILNEIGVVHRNYRINNRYFDFYLPEYDLIIERDGEQHYYEPFMIVGSRMKSIEQNHQNDIEKTNLAKSKGHKICRIPYWLSEEDEKKEIQNILNGQPTYPDVPDLEQVKTKPLPN